MTPTKTTVTDDADLITYHAKETGIIPKLYRDPLSGRVTATVTMASRIAFMDDVAIQRFLTAKKAVWRAITELRTRGSR